MLKIYGIKACDTMKKAFTWLDQQGIAYEFHDYKKAGAPATEVKRWIKQLGWDTVINKRGTSWKKLPEARRAAMDSADALAAAQENPSLIKRPMIEQGTILLAGFNPDEWQQALKK